MVDYQLLHCECGGTIGMYDRQTFSCECCGQAFDLYRLDYDTIKINDKTGWMFPVKYK